MPELYSTLEPSERGKLDVGDGHTVYWETCGNPAGKPALVLHGGPGSGCTPWHRRLFDPNRYRIVLYDQRNCGRSRPHASHPDIDRTNTTPHLVADIERLREHLSVQRWLILGGSWGSTLALACAEANAGRVIELILFGVTAGLRREFDRVFRGGLAARFPGQWRRLRAAVLPESDREGDVVDAVHRLLFDLDPAFANAPPTSGASGNPPFPSGPPPPPFFPGFATLRTRSASLASSPTTSVMTRGSTTAF